MTRRKAAYFGERFVSRPILAERGHVAPFHYVFIGSALPLPGLRGRRATLREVPWRHTRNAPTSVRSATSSPERRRAAKNVSPPTDGGCIFDCVSSAATWAAATTRRASTRPS